MVQKKKILTLTYETIPNNTSFSFIEFSIDNRGFIEFFPTISKIHAVNGNLIVTPTTTKVKEEKKTTSQLQNNQLKIVSVRLSHAHTKTVLDPLHHIKNHEQTHFQSTNHN